ncbi:hypothetical protein PL75_10130 [Neisseria arctica]|uniref:ParB-like N-terminal domain-containing protein n=1 Tax=Neisseria arctica TaxID=1470200 RepID=A0A0J0YPL1_9NEIS|nr:ParB N-terminal domain-containing protein [Neisseria arctica]KLT72086.1 hypothetical protein PL75_10130 [Neisseria arctica]UOO87662.1 ParB N-terminal domain-containing protein [Neisseria arctica]
MSLENRNKLTQGLAGLSLHVGTPAQTAMNLTDKPHMGSGMFMNLPVEEIELFDKNPRRRHDAAAYAAIKESIRATGIQQPVHVTQRPDEGHYVLAQGGNTRLQIVFKIQMRTGAERMTLSDLIRLPMAKHLFDFWYKLFEDVTKASLIAILPYFKLSEAPIEAWMSRKGED